MQSGKVALLGLVLVSSALVLALADEAIPGQNGALDGVVRLPKQPKASAAVSSSIRLQELR